MGLKTNDSGAKYLRLKGGNFYLHTDKEFGNPYNSVEGLITDMSYRNEEFQGGIVQKLYITISDEEDSYRFGVNTQGRIYGDIISFLKNADLSKVIEVVAATDKERVNKDGDPVNMLFIKQDNEWMHKFFTKTSEEQLPEWKKIEKRGVVSWDRDDYLDALDKIVNDEFIPVVSKNVVEQPKKGEPNIIDGDTDEVEDPEVVEDDDNEELPF